MVVETDYNNANIIVKRGTDLIHTFKFIEFIPAIKIKEINDIKTEMTEIYKKQANPETQKEVEMAEEKYFNKLLEITCENPISHRDALEKFSLPEINQISEEAYIFLVNWSSIEEVKRYGSSVARTQTEKKEEDKSKSSQT